MSAVQVPLAIFLRQLSDKGQVLGGSGGEVRHPDGTLEVRDTPVMEVLQVVARAVLALSYRSLAACIISVPSVRQDRGVLVRRRASSDRRGIDQHHPRDALAYGANVRAQQDGLVVVSDVVEVLGRVNQLVRFRWNPIRPRASHLVCATLPGVGVGINFPRDLRCRSHASGQRVKPL